MKKEEKNVITFRMKIDEIITNGSDCRRTMLQRNQVPSEKLEN